MWQEASEEKREKMLANLDRSGGKTALQRSKPVECIETGIIYTSIHEAERMTGIRNPNISQVCNGHRKTAGGFHWRFVEKE